VACKERRRQRGKVIQEVVSVACRSILHQVVLQLRRHKHTGVSGHQQDGCDWVMLSL
jgi:hypothetical protein